MGRESVRTSAGSTPWIIMRNRQLYNKITNSKSNRKPFHLSPSKHCFLNIIVHCSSLRQSFKTRSDCSGSTASSRTAARRRMWTRSLRGSSGTTRWSSSCPASPCLSVGGDAQCKVKVFDENKNCNLKLPSSC